MDNKDYQYKDDIFFMKYLKYKSKYLGLVNKSNKVISKDVSICIKKRDGFSGCRTCCKKHFLENSYKYNKCVDICMNSSGL